MSNRSLGLMIPYTISLCDVVCAKVLTACGRLILYSIILPLIDLIMLCVYGGCGLAFSFDFEFDGSCVAFEGTPDGAPFVPFCPL
jgi:hypothetical protein